MTDEKTIQEVEAANFKRNNGIALRTIATIFPVSFAEYHAIETAVRGRGVDSHELRAAIDYLEGQGLVDIRDIETKHKVRFCDMDKEDIEIKLSSEGKLVVMSIKVDAGVDL